jgi:hypothetical protein
MILLQLAHGGDQFSVVAREQGREHLRFFVGMVFARRIGEERLNGLSVAARLCIGVVTVQAFDETGQLTQVLNDAPVAFVERFEVGRHLRAGGTFVHGHSSFHSYSLS